MKTLLSQNDWAKLLQVDRRKHLVICLLQAFPALTLHITFFSFTTRYSLVQNPENGSSTFLLKFALVYQIIGDLPKSEALSAEHRRVTINNYQVPTIFTARILAYDGEPNVKSEKKSRPYCVQL